MTEKQREQAADVLAICASNGCHTEDAADAIGASDAVAMLALYLSWVASFMYGVVSARAASFCSYAEAEAMLRSGRV